MTKKLDDSIFRRGYVSTTGLDVKQEEKTTRIATDLKDGEGRQFTPGKVSNSSDAHPLPFDKELAKTLDCHSLESIVELKISRFLEQIGTYYPEALHATIMRKTEKPLLNQILRRTGGNQVHAARILGINRNTLRKKMKFYGFC